jgi:hypothetical protein
MPPLSFYNSGGGGEIFPECKNIIFHVNLQTPTHSVCSLYITYAAAIRLHPQHSYDMIEMAVIKVLLLP